MKRITQFQVSGFRLQVLFPKKILSREGGEGSEGKEFYLRFSSRSSRDTFSFAFPRIDLADPSG
jgi:hypothetical protein